MFNIISANQSSPNLGGIIAGVFVAVLTTLFVLVILGGFVWYYIRKKMKIYDARNDDDIVLSNLK